MYRKFIALFCLISLLLCACQETPETPAVISKNDGQLEQKMDETAPTQADTALQYERSISSTDGSVEISVSIDQMLSPDVNSVIEVAAHKITSEDAQRVAVAVLGEGDFYETPKDSSRVYSKATYLKRINRLSQYATMDTLTALMGESDAELYLSYVQDYISYWVAASETAPEEEPRTPTDWALKKHTDYHDLEDGDTVDDVLYLEVERNDIEYSCGVVVRDAEDYKTECIYVQPAGELYSVEKAIYYAQLCRTDKPTDTQIEAAQEKAESILSAMELGQWQLARTEVQTKEVANSVEYTIQVYAVPVLNGIAALYGMPTATLSDSYNSELALTSVEFIFAPNGEILWFRLISPLDVVNLRNGSVATMSVTELMDTALEHLSLSDAGAYGWDMDSITEMEQAINDKIVCTVNISAVDFGLGRIAIQDSKNYYYVPVMCLRGTADYVAQKSGKVYYSNHRSSKEYVPALLWVNAVDGSVIS